MKFFLIIILIVSCLKIYPQINNLKFENNLIFIDKQGYNIENIIVLSEDKIIRYNENDFSVLLNKNSDNENSSEFKGLFAFDKSYKSYKSISYVVDSDKNIRFTDFGKWKKIKNSHKLNKKEQMFLESLGLNEENKNKIKIRKTSEEKTIDNYKCRKYIVVKNDKTYTVWTTNEVSYNWASLDFINKIPGTAILIENETDDVVYKLLEINSSYDRTIFNEENLKIILENWD
jgi:hypothetical protein